MMYRHVLICQKKSFFTFLHETCIYIQKEENLANCSSSYHALPEEVHEGFLNETSKGKADNISIITTTTALYTVDSCSHHCKEKLFHIRKI